LIDRELGLYSHCWRAAPIDHRMYWQTWNSWFKWHTIWSYTTKPSWASMCVYHSACLSRFERKCWLYLNCMMRFIVTPRN